MKTIKVLLITIAVPTLIALVILLFENVKIEMPPLVVRSPTGGPVTVSADKTRFTLILELGALDNYISSRRKSREDERELASSRQLARFVADAKLEGDARKQELLIDVPSGTRCEEIQRLQFPETSFSPSIVGVQVRILDGAHRGFEGWVFESQIGH